ISMTEEIKQQAALHPELRLIVAEASDSLGKQIGDVEKFEGLGIDLLIISPLESEALTPTVSRLYQSIPVVVVNRSVANDDYTLFIGPDNTRIGQEAGRFVSRTLAVTGGEVLEILGRSGSPPTLERAQGFRHEVAQNPLIRVQSPILANWLRDGAQDLVAERLTAGALAGERPPQVIFAHNDAMAYGAWLAADGLKMAKKITFLGVDGLDGPRGGRDLLASGILDATFLSPTGGKEAVEYALALLRHQGEQPKNIILGTKLLTREDLSASPAPAANPSRLRKVGLLWSSLGGGWNQRLEASATRALGTAGWTTVTVTGPELPPDLDLLVVDAADRDGTDRARREAGEAAARTRHLPFFRLGPQPAQGDDSGWAVALGPDPFEEGRRAGWWLGRNGAPRVWEVTGPGSGTAELSRGLTEGLADRGSFLAGTTATDGTRDGTARALADAWKGRPAFEGVLAHSDEEALGAVAALEAMGRHPGTEVRVVAVGGGPEARAALAGGTLSCVVRNPDDLGGLVRSEAAQYLDSPGVSRRLVTNHDAVAGH
ncbi:MAG TPA: substrate-binding domain-containing protein, partial [Spirochaetia bacterium]|nr:substrate-binding domain-containing protein [Spirochaetia bacterium]